jgi:signal peptidase I
VRRSKPAAIAREYLDGLLAAGLLALFFFTFVIRPYSIPSVSMVPTLQVGDVVLVDQIAYHLRKPQFGDVAVFEPPVPSFGDDFIKRVIGVPGDSIAIVDGTVVRNGTRLVEPYENQAPRYDLRVENYGIFVRNPGSDWSRLSSQSADIPPRAAWRSPDRIPEGFYFMLGDNRNYSDDSHVWGFAQLAGRFASGPLASRDVRARFAGRAFAILWPWGRLRIVR